MREQLVAQITLGIAGGDLSAGEKLPSTRELARRFKVHSNTIGFAYQKLCENKLIELKKGSGFYVRTVERQNSAEKISLNSLIADFFQTAHLHGFSELEIRNCLQKQFNASLPERILVIESDKNLCRILVEEIKQTADLPVLGASFSEFVEKHQFTNVIFTAMNDEKEKVKNFLPAEKKCIFIKARSVSNSMIGKKRPQKDDLIAVVSGWEKFLSWSKTILIAAGIESDSIILRSTAEKHWKRSLTKTSMIICDALTAKKI